MRAWIVGSVALVACGGSSDDAPADTDPPATADTADTFTPGADTDEEPVDPTDTGVLYAMQVRGEAIVARGVKFEGWQTLSAHWLRGGTELLAPRCIYQQDVLNWARARPGEDDPNENQLPSCPTCDFAFTVVTSGTRVVERFPDTPDPDTDDTDPPPPDVVPGPAEGGLSCESLVAVQGFPAADAIDEQIAPTALGFSSAADGDGNLGTGVVYRWIAQAGSWSQESGTATFDGTTGTFRWSFAQAYEYVRP